MVTNNANWFEERLVKVLLQNLKLSKLKYLLYAIISLCEIKRPLVYFNW